MKYRLINLKTKKEHLCDKVTIDGFDYYFSNTLQINWRDLVYNKETHDFFMRNIDSPLESDGVYFKILATNNPNIDSPKVVSKNYVLEGLALKETKDIDNSQFDRGVIYGFFKGYNKSQETHPFNEDDMIEFETFCNKYDYENGFGKTDRKELLQLWKEQRLKIVYYE